MPQRSFEGVADEEAIARLNVELVTAFERSGHGLVSSTRLHGTYAIRLCVMNHTTGPDDVRGGTADTRGRARAAAGRVSEIAHDMP